MELRFTVVVPVLNLRGSLDLLMRCLEAQTFPRSRFECIVVDDGSTDGSGEFLDTYSAGFPLRVIDNDVNRGRSEARNLGCREARGEILVFLDGDVLPAPSWLDEYDKAFRDQRAEVLSGGRYSVTVDPRRASTELGALLQTPVADLFRGDLDGQFERLHRRARLGQYPTPLYERLERELHEVCIEWPRSVVCGFSFITSNVAVYRRRFEQTTGFCPFIVRLQDTELGLQLWEGGCTFGFVRAAAGYHLFYPSFVDLDSNYRDVLAMFWRHPYAPVLKMVCWGLHKAPLATKARLRDLAATADVDSNLEREFFETFNRPVPANCHHPLESMIDYAAEHSRLPREEVARYLQCGLTDGLFAVRRQGRLFLDRQHTVNWLQNGTLFRQSDVQQNCCFNNPTALQAGAPGPRVSYRAVGRYEITVPIGLFGGREGEATMQVPLPAHYDDQPDFCLRAFRPPAVTECHMGDHLVYSWRVDAAAEDVVVGYEFSCDLQETADAVRPSPKEDIQSFRHSRLPPASMETATALLRRIAIDPHLEPVARARAIYMWILDHYAYRESTLSNLLVFEIGVGPCHHAAKLFVELCRLIGIPARERCGALLQKVIEPGEPQTVESVERGYSPFTHTWAEFHDVERGWVSVEFLGWMLGARTMTVRNVRDESLRTRVTSMGKMYDRYFFGQLDPFRVRSHSISNKLRTYPVLKTNTSWDDIHRALFETRHRLTATLTRLTGSSMTQPGQPQPFQTSR
jgi:glycosyltransferase involved in cell wall biosynthesis/transglutaminase-like putative cysteine protease